MEAKRFSQKVLPVQHSSLSGKSKLPGWELFGLKTKDFSRFMGALLFFILLGAASAKAADTLRFVSANTAGVTDTLEFSVLGGKVKPIAGDSAATAGVVHFRYLSWTAAWFTVAGEDTTLVGTDDPLVFDTATVYRATITFEVMEGAIGYDHIPEFTSGDSVVINGTPYEYVTVNDSTISITFPRTYSTVPQYTGSGIGLVRPKVGDSVNVATVTIDNVSGIKTATVNWSPSSPTFSPDDEYTATIKLVADSGYTFYRTGDDWFKVTPSDSIVEILSVVHTPNSDSIVVAFDRTEKRIPTDLKNNYGLPAPVAGDSVKNEVIQGVYSPGNIATDSIPVTWYKKDSTTALTATDRFDTATVYVAEFVIADSVIKDGYTKGGSLKFTHVNNGDTADVSYHNDTVTVIFRPTEATINIWAGGYSSATDWENALIAAKPAAGSKPIPLDSFNLTNKTFTIDTLAWRTIYGSGLDDAGRFAADSTYQAVLTLSPKPHYTTVGVADVGTKFSIAGGTLGHDNITIEEVTRDYAVFSATYAATATNPINDSVFVVTKPIAGAARDTVATADSTYLVGTVDWKPTVDSDSIYFDSDSIFKAGTAYTATFDIALLTVDSTSTLYGLPENFYKVAGADSARLEVDTLDATKGKLSVYFPATSQTISLDFPIRIPVAGDTLGTLDRVTGIDNQYETSVLKWGTTDDTLLHAGSPFDTATVYQVEFTIETLLPGYTLYGADSSQVKASGSTVDSAKIEGNKFTIVFAPTYSTITISEASPIPFYPSENRFPEDSVTAPDYTGVVTWYDGRGEVFSSQFAKDTVYTAKIKLEPKIGYTLYKFSSPDTNAVAKNVFGAATANSVSYADSVLTIVYKPAEAAPGPPDAIAFTLSGSLPKAGRVIDTVEVRGIDAAGVVLIDSIGDPVDSLRLKWTPDSLQKFSVNSAYSVKFRIVAALGKTVYGLAADFFELEGASVTNPASEGDTVEVTITIRTNPLIQDTLLTVTPPKAGAVPEQTLKAAGGLKEAKIAWNADVFYPDSAYTATVIVEPDSAHTLYGLPANFFKVNDATTVTSTPDSTGTDSVTVTITFKRTEKRITSKHIVLTAPETGEIAPIAVIDTSATPQWGALIEWSPALNNGAFYGDTAYTATFEFSGRNGYTAFAVNFDDATVNDSAVSVVFGVVSYTFPKTWKTGIHTPRESGLTVVGSDGILKIKGLTVGEPVSVYNLQGVLVARRTAVSEEQEIALTAGVYIVVTDRERVKVLQR